MLKTFLRTISIAGLAIGFIDLASAYATITIQNVNGGTLGGLYTSAQTTGVTGTNSITSVNSFYYYVQYPGNPFNIVSPLTTPWAFPSPSLAFLNFTPLNITATNLSSSTESQQGFPNRVEIAFTSNATVNLTGTQNSVVTIQIYPTQSTPRFLPIATLNGSACTNGICQGYQQTPSNISNSGGGYYTAVDYTPNSTIRIGFYPNDLCAINGTGQGCSSTGVLIPYPSTASLPAPVPNPAPTTGAPTTIQLVFSLWLAPDSQPNTVPTGNPVDNMTTPLSFTFQSDPPQLTCPAPAPTAVNQAVLYPGDTQVYFNTSIFSGSGISGVAPMQNMWIVGQDNTQTLNPPVTNSSFDTGGNTYLFGPFAFGTANQPATGFTNSTGSTPHNYSVSFVAQDATGVYVGAPVSSCTISDVESAAIQGFLAKSNCFIATAAFRSIDSEPVALLRLFRDQVLLQSEWGTAFVGWYYRWSPPAAEWLMEHPLFRLPVLLGLAPLEAGAWLCLHPLYLALTLFGVGGVWLGLYFSLRERFLRKKKASLLILLLLAFILPRAGHAEEGEVQPYIDQIKKQLDQEQASEPEESFIESKKKELEKEHPSSTESGQSYIEQLKQENPQKFSPRPGESNEESYTEKEKAKLSPKPEGGAIQAVAEGKSELKPKQKGDIHYAWGFRYGASVNSAIAAIPGYYYRDFNSVYGGKYAPNVSLYYEYQPFHNEWFGSFGLVALASLGYYQGYGQYSFPVPIPGGGGETFPLQSQIQFQFISVPVTAAVDYRFNLLKFLRPFVMAGPTLIGYAETRSDGISGKYGYSTAFFLSGGIAITLDWIDPNNAWDLYETHQIHHYYLNIDYSRYIALTGPVSFQTNGVFAGLSYEF